ncbi:PQQ-binding-like beta-propeller repeat protein [Streptomyces sp. FR-108]|uniref:outer membrane protein assembly factor BamB family protein n=1 Tax=Streptomyces sp. FR-108 TaxID=3416665 RepID=UPI003CE7A11B
MRRPFSRAAGALTLLVLAACTGAGDEGGAAGDGKPLPSSARANAFETVWSRSVRGQAGVPAVTDDVVLVPHGHMIDVRDARTGRNRRTLRADPTDQIVGVNLTGEVIVARVAHNSFTILVGFDVRTGRQLWTQPYETRGIVMPGEEPEVELYGTGPVIVTERGIVVHAHGGRNIGLNPRTGETIWQQQAECDNRAYTAAGALGDSYYAAITGATARYSVTLCREGPRTVLKATDPHDGDIVWRTDMERRGGGTKFSTSKDVVGVRSTDAGNNEASFALFDESGDRMAGGTVKDPVGDIRTVGRVAETVYFHDGRQLHALRADGSTLWVQDAPGHLGLSAQAVVSDGETLTPRSVQRTGVSVVIDLSGKKRATLPWPLRGELVGMSGELLIVRGGEEDGTRYTALRLTRRDLKEPALGGVAPSDWPDACSLLSDEQLDGLGEVYRRLPVGTSRTVFGVEVPHPTQCRFAGESGPDTDIFQIAVRWVAADSDAAGEIAASDLPWDTGVERLGRSAFLVPEPGTSELDLARPAVVSSGRYVLDISAPKNEKLVRRVALLLAG